jgi:hypothetical protein
MILDPPQASPGEDRQRDANDLFRKLDALMQKHQERAPKPPSDAVPTLEGALAQGQAPPAKDVPVLHDAVARARAADQSASGLLADHRRQLQVALYLRLRQRLDQELNAALADDLRLGAVPLHPAFARAAQELRSVLPVVVREAVEQVFGQQSLEALLGRAAQRGDDEG